MQGKEKNIAKKLDLQKERKNRRHKYKIFYFSYFTRARKTTMYYITMPCGKMKSVT